MSLRLGKVTAKTTSIHAYVALHGRYIQAGHETQTYKLIMSQSNMTKDRGVQPQKISVMFPV